jgi:hypothetical protein
MKVTNTRDQRQAALNKYGPEYFETTWDYFFFHHLNTTVQHWHGIPVTLGLIVWGLAIVDLNIWLGMIGLFLMYVPQIASHWIYDRYVATESVDTPLITIYHAYKLYFLWLSCRIGKYEEAFLQKYPFAARAYQK